MYIQYYDYVDWTCIYTYKMDAKSEHDMTINESRSVWISTKENITERILKIAYWREIYTNYFF